MAGTICSRDHRTTGSVFFLPLLLVTLLCKSQGSALWPLRHNVGEVSCVVVRLRYDLRQEQRR